MATVALATSAVAVRVTAVVSVGHAINTAFGAWTGLCVFMDIQVNIQKIKKHFLYIIYEPST
jgi:hypothetical protein